MMKKYLMVIFASLMFCLISSSFVVDACAQTNTNAGNLNAGDFIKTPEAGLDVQSIKIGEKTESVLDKAVNNALNSNKSGEGSGSSTSGNVEFTGSTSLSSDYGTESCGSGNIFQQLACRAGVIGSGLKTVGYMIAGFGLIVFSFAAIFGKVKWPVFATIMFCCFLLSATVFVVNMMTKDGDASWIGGVEAGSISASSTSQPKGNVDANEVSQQNS